MRSKQTEKESPAESTSTPAPPRSSRTRRRRVALMAAIALLTVATTVIARFASSRGESAAPSTSPEALTATAPLPAPDPVVPVPSEVVNVVAEKPKHTAVVTTARSRAHSAPLPAVTANSSNAESASSAGAAEPITSASTVESTATDAVGPAPVTITGCLETTLDGGEFRLTDTEGVDAPMARSWRSGFLKKRAAPVQLVELSDPKGLQKYVGRRVVATGQLTSRELRVRSLQPAGVSCKTD
jgi:hypothetical protein